MPSLLNVETHPEQPIAAQGIRLLPFAQCMTLRFPFTNFHVTWTRPVSVLVTGSNGEDQVLLVRDATRQIVWTLYGMMAVVAVLGALWYFARRP
jgi:hypothetical protein